MPTKTITVDEYKKSLEDMCYQFAGKVTYKGKPALSTDGLSALEGAFDVLGWDNPHIVDDDVACEIKGCCHWSSCGVKVDGLYLHLCSEHFMITNEEGLGNFKVKQKALDREATRDKTTGFLP